jgi:hypothetical protein
MVDVDSPVSTTLMTYIKEDLDWLKATLTDGAAAPQDVNSADLSVYGDLTVTGDTSFNGGDLLSGAATLNWWPETKFQASATFDGNLTLTGLDLDMVVPLIQAEGF